MNVAPLAKTKNKLRERISEEALNAWYILLWHHRIHGLLPDLDKSQIRMQLFQLLHLSFRDDEKIVLGAFRVWALASAEGNANCSFDEAMTDIDIANLVAGPVNRELVPPIWRIDAGMDTGIDLSEFVEVNDLGLHHLFGRWHLKQLDDLLAGIEIKEVVDAVPFSDKSVLEESDITLLCRILGHLDIPATVIYGMPSEMNVYSLIKLSGLDFEAQNNAAGRLFDRLPADFPKTLIGQYIKLSRSFKLTFLFGDAVLGHSGPGLWLQYDQDRKIAAVVEGQLILMAAVAEGITLIKDFLVSRIITQLATDENAVAES